MSVRAHLRIGLPLIACLATIAHSDDVEDAKRKFLCHALRIGATPTVVTPVLTHRVAPKYPKEAKKTKLQGSVELRAMIGTDGRAKDISVVSGDKILADAAIEAVRKWRYSPGQANNAPVEVKTNIVVTFTLNGSKGEVEAHNFQPSRTDNSEGNAAPKEGAASADAGQMSSADAGQPVGDVGGDSPTWKPAWPVYKVIGKEVTPPKEIYAPEPEYSNSAREAKTNGSVILGLIITPEGRVGDLAVCRSLEPSLDRNALNTVRRWKFQPATKEGMPVAVHVQIEVTYRLY